jgi:hypothetical protein
MDACRPDRDDLSLPEMADLEVALRKDGALRSEWESRQRSDRRLAGAMHDVSVPAGLAERILAAAEGARAGLGASINQAVATGPDLTAEVSPRGNSPPALRISRRLAWRLVATAALVFMGILGVWQVWLRPPQTVTRVQLEEIAQGWFNTAIQQTKPMPPSVKPPLPFPRRDVASSFQSWQRLPAAEKPVAFDLTNRHSRGKIFLFAARTKKDYEVQSVPYTPLTATRGLEMGAWQQGDVLYVVVVDREKSGLRLEHVLRKPKLALLLPR